ncbi:MAG: hypothetical protein KKD05_02125 [Candidatus Omnitrophica bacterium]|nr:hypothetical protein [Candidatus Omnitrophota bacterium]
MMRLKNVVMYSVVITAICLTYVRQQVEIVKLSYLLRDKEKSLNQMIDHNQTLLYNNMSLKSPQYLANMLKQNNMDLSFPEPAAVAKVRVIRKPLQQLAKTPGLSWKTNLFDLLVPKAQAASDIRK